MGIPRGGTGGGTPAEARASLGIQSGFCGMLPIEPGVEAVEEIQFDTPFPYNPKIALSLIGTYDTTDIFLTVKTIYKDRFFVSAYSNNHTVSPSFAWIAIQ